MRATTSMTAEGQRFLMLDYLGNPLDIWQVVHANVMPSGRIRTTVFNVEQPADMFDIYADELADPSRFVCLDDAVPATRYDAQKRAA